MFKTEKQSALRMLAALITITALIASTTGVAWPDSYKSVLPRTEQPFVFGQDLVSMAAAAALLAIWKPQGAKANILRFGIVGYLFYAYAPYVMGTLYTYYYFLYLAVVGLTIFYFIVAFTGIDYAGTLFRLPTFLRIAVAIYCASIAVYFAPQWVTGILHNIRMHSGPGKTGFDFIYYVYVLDMCFVLPVCVIASVQLLQKKVLGAVLGGTLSVMGAILMLSVAMGYFCQPLFHQTLDKANAAQFSVLTFVFLVLSVFFFAYTKVERLQRRGDCDV